MMTNEFKILIDDAGKLVIEKYIQKIRSAQARRAKKRSGIKKTSKMATR